MKLIKKTIFVTAAVTLGGCASMMTGTTQEIKVDSHPSGAKVYTAVHDKSGNIIEKTESGITPTNVKISRKDGVIIIEKEGYKSANVPLQDSMNSWMWGNILLTSPLSTSIDTSTGASNEYDPGEYTVELTAK